MVELVEATGASRLVTLVGEAGVGKTRLAQRFAAVQRSAYESVWFCDLRHAHDAEAMSAALARTLSIADEATLLGDAAVMAVGRALAARGRALVVLDNVEQLLPRGADVVLAWLDLAPAARLVVTSKEPLYLVGEELLEVEPLPVPDGLDAPVPGADASDAVALFVARVRAIEQEFVPSGEQERAIAAMVRRVRGVPLAIELCASRFSAGEPPARARHPHGVLPAGGPFDAIAWSFCKLDPMEREALAQCSVFRGSFTLEAAERVVDLPARDWPMPRRIGGVLAALVKKSLLQLVTLGETPKPPAQPVRFDAGSTGARFTVCEGIRAHAASLLDQSAEGAGAPWRHARLYLDLASGPLLDLPGADGAATTRDELAAERDNLEAVFELGASQGRHDLILRAAIALDFLSSGTGLSRPQLAKLDEALQGSRSGAVNFDPRMVGRALGVRAGALRALGQLDEAERDARTALSLARRAGSTRQIVAMHLAVGGARFQIGDLDEALAHTRAGSEAARAGGYTAEEALGLQQTGAVLQAMGEASEARVHYEAALQLALDFGEIAEARAAMGLGSYHLEAGDLERAEVSYERGLLIARRRGMARSARIVMGYLGVLRFDAGDLQEAERWLDSAARASRATGDLRVEGIFEGMRGAVLASLDLVDEARTAFALAHQLLGPHPYFDSVIELHHGHLDLAEAREAASEGHGDRAAALVAQAAQRIAAAEARQGEAPPLVRRSDDARIAVRILRRALAEARPQR